MTDIYVEKLARMIRHETISCREDTDLTKFYEFQDLLHELFPNLYGVVREKKMDGSFLLRWPGTDPSKKPIMFMNHQDVVEAGGKWEHPAFCGEVFDGKLWGRGTLDTKGGLFAMMQAADELVSEGFVPERDIYFESSCDEETAMLGADNISVFLKDNNIEFEMVFDEGGTIQYDPIGGADGTFAMIGVGEKGTCDIKFTARSNGGHASTPPKNTPLIRLGKFMAKVEKKDPFRRELSPTVIEMLRRLAPFMSGRTKFLASHAKLFAPVLKIALPNLSPTAGAVIRTTIAFTMIKGSDGTNVLPQEAYVIGNMRFSHHQGREESIDLLRPIAEKYGIEIEVLEPGGASRIADYNGSAFRLVEKAAREVSDKIDAVVPFVMTGATDSHFMDKVCSQIIRFIPFYVTAEQMSGIHGLNENISVDQLEPAVKYYKILMKEA